MLFSECNSIRKAFRAAFVQAAKRFFEDAWGGGGRSDVVFGNAAVVGSV